MYLDALTKEVHDLIKLNGTGKNTGEMGHSDQLSDL